ncbi:sigma-70 family RNA polymerase sigma factor [Chachezhania antarctica]|uniref:sigma-70 family RNA polymerase sigma factor n=1 Tax=Chachezhania antarctica TaxID=2340860 RepID=UPI000EB09104|nr:sigma-70 family RNA polymerase sigma factor [Chachezhania antarctica]|tara:strand:- start:175 stop:717 length:543 start_codon:yes stop_codon:yes gene_type:complete
MTDLERIEAMISRVALGDRAAFSDLYDATSAKLLGVCLRVLKDRSLAEDAMQDAYVKIWSHAGRYTSGVASPMTWLITIARNTAIDRARMRKPADNLADHDATLTATGPTPEQSTVAASLARRVTQCLAELQTDRAAAIRLAYLEGLSYADLAERFEVPLNTIRTWLRRGLMTLRACVER